MSDITGKVIKILDAQRFVSQKNGNEYVRNTFVLETSGQHPKKVAFSVMGAERLAQMGIVVGGQYSVSFDVESREWKERWFTECNAWKAVRIDGQQQQLAPQQQKAIPVTQPVTATTESSTPSNDLPF